MCCLLLQRWHLRWILRRIAWARRQRCLFGQQSHSRWSLMPKEGDGKKVWDFLFKKLQMCEKSAWICDDWMFIITYCAFVGFKVQFGFLLGHGEDYATRSAGSRALLLFSWECGGGGLQEGIARLDFNLLHFLPQKKDLWSQRDLITASSYHWASKGDGCHLECRWMFLEFNQIKVWGFEERASIKRLHFCLRSRQQDFSINSSTIDASFLTKHYFTKYPSVKVGVRKCSDPWL